jgi:hypothetical protein
MPQLHSNVRSHLSGTLPGIGVMRVKRIDVLHRMQFGCGSGERVAGAELKAAIVATLRRTQGSVRRNSSQACSKCVADAAGKGICVHR